LKSEPEEKGEDPSGTMAYSNGMAKHYVGWKGLNVLYTRDIERLSQENGAHLIF